jgi:hypothetical protein
MRQACLFRPRTAVIHVYRGCGAPRLVPMPLAALSIGAGADRDSRAFIALSRKGWAESSVGPFRASLSSFFAGAVRQRIISANPVTITRLPRASTPRVEKFPFSEADLERVYLRGVERDGGWRTSSWLMRGRAALVEAASHPSAGLHPAAAAVLMVQRAEPEGASRWRARNPASPATCRSLTGVAPGAGDGHRSRGPTNGCS